MKTYLSRVYITASTLLLAVLLTSCSAQETIRKDPPKGDKNLSFYYNDEGSRNHYEVYFNRNNKISSLYINGKEIPESEYDNYEGVIQDNIDALRSPDRKKERYVYKYDFDSDKFKEGMKELHKNLPKRKFWLYDGADSSMADRKNMYHFNWNDSTFKESMKKMNEDLAKLKDLDIKFDFEPYKLRIDIDQKQLDKEIEIMKENLINMREELKEIRKQLKEKK
jgi:hypothetical protein